MSKANRLEHADRIPVRAAAARVSGTPTIEKGLAGIPITDAAAGALYSLDTSQGVKDVPLVSGAAVGNTCFINQTTGALTVAAKGTAAVAGTEPFGRVVATPTDPGNQPAPKTGRMWVLRFPQQP